MPEQFDSISSPVSTLGNPPDFINQGLKLVSTRGMVERAPVAVEAVFAPIVTGGVALPDDTTPTLGA